MNKPLILAVYAVLMVVFSMTVCGFNFYDDFENADYTSENWTCLSGNCVETSGYIASNNLLAASFQQNFSYTQLWDIGKDWDIHMSYYIATFSHNVCFYLTDSNSFGGGTGVYICPSTENGGTTGKDMAISCQGSCSCAASLYTMDGFYVGNYNANLSSVNNTISISRDDGATASTTVTCDMSQFNTILLISGDGGTKDKVYDVNMTGGDICFVDWVCDNFTVCGVDDTFMCNSVFDNSNCSEPYTGDYTEFGEFSCNYCTAEITDNPPVCDNGTLYTISINNNYAECCNMTMLANDCIIDGKDYTINEGIYQTISECIGIAENPVSLNIALMVICGIFLTMFVVGIFARNEILIIVPALGFFVIAALPIIAEPVFRILMGVIGATLSFTFVMMLFTKE